jgi:hypothetical protein
LSKINDYLKDVNGLRKKGRCLHFDAGKRCDQFINAHSIQKGNLLNVIAENGHVYRLNSEISTLKKNNGKIEARKISINKVSTFLGFCKKHDNQLFEQIDNYPLLPIESQVFLYAYRSLCRELFVKENSVNLYKNQLINQSLSRNISALLSNLSKGTDFGLKCLLKHKNEFDESLRNKRCNDIKYVAFLSEGRPSILFSGLLYPDFDFSGRLIQDLSDQTKLLKLITFFSARTEAGWAFVFAWHKHSDPICDHYMRSLATYIYEKGVLADILFRYVFSCCENHAISPAWWDGLTDKAKIEIYERFEHIANIQKPIMNNYLREGIEGISDWSFSSVISAMQ